MGSYYWTNFGFVKQILLHISRSWPRKVRFVHSWAGFGLPICYTNLIRGLSNKEMNFKITEQVPVNMAP